MLNIQKKIDANEIPDEYRSLIRYESQNETQNFPNSKYNKTLELVKKYEKEIIFLKELLLDKETIFESDIHKIKSL